LTVINDSYNEYNNLVGAAFLNIRKGEGVTQQELAERMSIDPKTISRIETGKNTLTINIIEKLSEPFVLTKVNNDLLDLCRQLITEPYEDYRQNNKA